MEVPLGRRPRGSVWFSAYKLLLKGEHPRYCYCILVLFFTFFEMFLVNCNNIFIAIWVVAQWWVDWCQSVVWLILSDCCDHIIVIKLDNRYR